MNSQQKSMSIAIVMLVTCIASGFTGIVFLIPRGGNGNDTGNDITEMGSGIAVNEDFQSYAEGTPASSLGWTVVGDAANALVYENYFGKKMLSMKEGGEIWIPVPLVAGYGSTSQPDYRKRIKIDMDVRLWKKRNDLLGQYSYESTAMPFIPGENYDDYNNDLLCVIARDDNYAGSGASKDVQYEFNVVGIEDDGDDPNGAMVDEGEQMPILNTYWQDYLKVKSDPLYARQTFTNLFKSDESEVSYTLYHNPLYSGGNIIGGDAHVSFRFGLLGGESMSNLVSRYESTHTNMVDMYYEVYIARDPNLISNEAIIAGTANRLKRIFSPKDLMARLNLDDSYWINTGAPQASGWVQDGYLMYGTGDMTVWLEDLMSFSPTTADAIDAVQGTWNFRIVPGIYPIGPLVEHSKDFTMELGGIGVNEPMLTSPYFTTPIASQITNPALFGDYFYYDPTNGAALSDDDYYFVVPSSVVDGQEVTETNMWSWFSNFGEHSVLIGVDPMQFGTGMLIDGVRASCNRPDWDDTPFTVDRVGIKVGPMFESTEAASVFSRILIDNIRISYIPQPEIQEIDITSPGFQQTSTVTESGASVKYVMKDDDRFKVRSLIDFVGTLPSISPKPTFSIKSAAGGVLAGCSWTMGFEEIVTQDETGFGTGTAWFFVDFTFPSTLSYGTKYRFEVSYTNVWGESDTDYIYARFFKATKGNVNFFTINTGIIDMNTEIVVPEVRFASGVTASVSAATVNVTGGGHSTGVVSRITTNVLDPITNNRIYYVDADTDVTGWGLVGGTVLTIDVTFSYSVSVSGAGTMTTTYEFEYILVLPRISASLSINVPGESGGVITEDYIRQQAPVGIRVYGNLNDPFGDELGNDMVVIVRDYENVIIFEETMTFITVSQFTSFLPTSIFNEARYEHTSFSIHCRVIGSDSSVHLSSTKYMIVDFNLPDFSIVSPIEDNDPHYEDTMEYVLQFASTTEVSNVYDIHVEIYSIDEDEVVHVGSGLTIGSGTDKDFQSIGSNQYIWDTKPTALGAGSYVMTVTVTDNALFTDTHTSQFLIGEYSPIINARIIVPKDALQNKERIWRGELNLTLYVESPDPDIFITRIDYAVYEDNVLLVDYGTDLGSIFPTNPIWTGSSLIVEKNEASATRFDARIFDTAEYEIRLKITTSTGIRQTFYKYVKISEKQGGTITDTDDTTFKVQHLEPDLYFDPDDPKPYDFVGDGSKYTYVTESDVWFRGTVTDVNADLLPSSLKLIINGLVTGSTTIDLYPTYTTEIDTGYEFAYYRPIADFLVSCEAILEAKDSKMTIAKQLPVTFRVDSTAPSFPDNTVNVSVLHIDSEYINITSSVDSPVDLTDVNFSIYVIDPVLGRLHVDTHVFSSSEITSANSDPSYVFSHTIPVSDLSVSSTADRDTSYRRFDVVWRASNVNDKVGTDDTSVFYVDKVIPSIEFLSNPSITASPATLRFGVSTSSGTIISPVTFSILNDISLVTLYGPVDATFISGSSYDVTFGFDEIGSNDTRFKVRVEASSTNSLSDSRIFDIEIIRLSPTISIISPVLVDGAVTYTSDVTSVNVRCNVNDGNGDLDVVGWRWQKINFSDPTIHESFSPMSYQSGEYRGTVDFSGEYGIWAVEIEANDTTGLLTRKSFTIERSEPVNSAWFVFDSPADQSSIGDSIVIKCTVTTGNSIVEFMEYNIPSLGSTWKFMTRYDEGSVLYFEMTVNTSAMPVGFQTIKARILGTGGYELQRSITVYKLPPVTPTVPAPVLNKGLEHDLNVTLYWTAVEGATSYQVYRSIIPFNDTGGASLVHTSLTVREYTDVVENLTDDVTYYYAVVAITSAGRSNISNIVTFTSTGYGNGETPPPSPSFLDQIIAFIMMIISFITGLFSLAIVRGRKRNIDVGIQPSIGCIFNPKKDSCRI